MRLRLVTPSWGFVSTFVFGAMCALAVPALAQPKAKPVKTENPPKAVADAGDAAPTPAPTAKKDGKKAPKEQNFNFEGLGLNGRSRSPQLLYFLERANEELERASLEKRSFIPHMVRSVEEEAL